ncbi:MAG: hypothetical protein U5L09_03660 [Bacteroidales bacterium]|nr:hypothetical protein [Bacteroidales bacterium]
MMEKTRNVAEKYFSADRIIHFHNLNLGKNPYWTLAVFELAEEDSKCGQPRTRLCRRP